MGCYSAWVILPLPIARGPISVIWKSLCTCSTFGTLLYLITRYPAFVSKACRSLSCVSLFLWLASSNSTTAKTSNALLRITKSATFLSNRFLVARDLALIIAEKATCPKTTCPFSASTNLKYIACSRGVRTCRFEIPPTRLFAFVRLSKAAAMTRIIAKLISKAVFIFLSPRFVLMGDFTVRYPFVVSPNSQLL